MTKFGSLLYTVRMLCSAGSLISLRQLKAFIPVGKVFLRKIDYFYFTRKYNTIQLKSHEFMCSHKCLYVTAAFCFLPEAGFQH